MVGPITDEERRAGGMKLQAIFIILVTVSAIGITLQIGPSMEQLLGAAVGGLAVGLVLSWYLTRTLREFSQGTRR